MEPSDPVAEILGRWREEAERGHVVDPEEVISTHPEHAEALRARFEAEALVERYFLETDGAGPSPPEQLGDYRILRELGRGGMGVVYEAEQVSMRRRVALKVLFPSIATTEETRKRFAREARVTGRLHHTNVVTVHQMGRQHGYLYFAMELVEGRPLDRVLRRLREQDGGSPAPLPAPFAGVGARERVAGAFAAVAEALEAAHVQGVIHRDVKPSNLILDESGTLKLTDFGLAHLASDATGVTQTGDRLGTPLYMSPEQMRARHSEVDARTDVYSLGATLYEVLTLHPPHDGEDLATLCAQVLTSEPAPVRRWNASIPVDLATIVAKAMEKDRDRRYATAGELATDLRAFADGRPIAARRLGPAERAWRLAMRHKVRTGLLAGLLLALGTAGVLARLAVRAAGEKAIAEARSRESEYTSLCTSAEDAFFLEAGEARGPTRVELFNRAISLMPDRYEAYLGRMICPESSLKQTLEDAESAAKRGAPSRAVLMARAYVFAALGKSEESAVSRKAAEGLPADDLISQYLEAQLAVGRGEVAKGLSLLSSIIDAAPHGSGVKCLARRARVHLLVLRHDSNAMRDIDALQAEGDRRPVFDVRLASTWRQLGHQDKAEEVLRTLYDRARAAGTAAAWIGACGAFLGGQGGILALQGRRGGTRRVPEERLPDRVEGLGDDVEGIAGRRARERQTRGVDGGGACGRREADRVHLHPNGTLRGCDRTASDGREGRICRLRRGCLPVQSPPSHAPSPRGPRRRERGGAKGIHPSGRAPGSRQGPR